MKGACPYPPDLSMSSEIECLRPGFGTRHAGVFRNKREEVVSVKLQRCEGVPFVNPTLITPDGIDLCMVVTFLSARCEGAECCR